MVSILKKKNKINQTPLHLACKYQLPLISNYLLTVISVNPNSEDSMKMTPFHLLLLGDIKKEEDFDWLKEINSQSLQSAIRNLDSAYKNFFNKSYLEEINLTAEEDLIIKKAYADPVGFKIKNFGDSNTVLESIQDKINMNDYAEILFLTKYIGDYNITKFGNKTLTLENRGHMLVVERI